MRLDGLQFQFLHQRFKPQRIQLLLPALRNVVIHEIDGVPDEVVNKEREGVAEDEPSKIVAGDQFFFIFRKESELLSQQQVSKGTEAGKDQCQQDELHDLFFQLFLEDVHLDDQHPHHVSKKNTQKDENSYPPKEQNPVAGC